MGKAFIIMLIILQALAALAYAVEGDHRRVIYWTAACIINAAVTF